MSWNSNVTIVLDSQIDQYKRTVSSLLDAVGTVGGIFGIIWSVAGLIMGFVIDKIFVYYLKQKKQTVFNNGMFSYDTFKPKDGQIEEYEIQFVKDQMKPLNEEREIEEEKCVNKEERNYLKENNTNERHKVYQSLEGVKSDYK